MNNIIMLIWLFLAYSFIGWILETTVSVIRKRRFINRGIINGPFCIIYGVGSIVITVFLRELNGIWLFVGATIVLTVVEWIAGHLVEKWYHKRWWDYKNIKWNLNGYISFPTSCLWGALGAIGMTWGNKLILNVYNVAPSIMKIVALVLIGLIILDGMATIIVLSGKSKNEEKWKATDAWLDSITARLRGGIRSFIEARINKAYPENSQVEEEEERNPNIFAYGCGFYKIVMLFLIGAFLGDITETIFCRITAGVWMSRSSVVWGPFSIVWGLAISAVTVLLYKYRNQSDTFLFLTGTFLGGAYEYICSVFTEVVFGTVFWDYSKMSFNLGGRINLLYCFFWGIAAVLWFKKLYPIVSKAIEKIPKKIGIIVTWILIVFMICNMLMSSMALSRYNKRGDGVPPQNSIEEWIDIRFDDSRMEKIYPNALKR